MKRFVQIMTICVVLAASLPLPGSALQVCLGTDHLGFAVAGQATSSN